MRNHEHVMKPGMELPLNRIEDDSAFTQRAKRLKVNFKLPP